jgi:hypothetical protein
MQNRQKLLLVLSSHAGYTGDGAKSCLIACQVIASLNLHLFRICRAGGIVLLRTITVGNYSLVQTCCSGQATSEFVIREESMKMEP